MNSWIDIFKENYYELLGPTASPDKKANKRNLQDGLYQRADGFLAIFSALEQQQKDQYHIVETGTMRNPGNWKDGQSSFLFTEFVRHHGGSVRSVDINPEAVDVANDAVDSEHFHATCNDSVTWLKSLGESLNNVDFFYLDSYDVKWADDHLSAEHHLQEFLAIEPHLKPGAVVAIDDNSRFRDSKLRTGKGRRIVEYLESYNKLPVYDHYQIIYHF
jgi:predicted O-methyltransferase YrrM